MKRFLTLVMVLGLLVGSVASDEAKSLFPVLAQVGEPQGSRTCRGELPTIEGSAGADRLVGTAGADVILAKGGNDVILGKGGDDIVCGGRGSDVLKGGNGKDVLLGGRGSDFAHGGAGIDVCRAEKEESCDETEPEPAPTSTPEPAPTSTPTPVVTPTPSPSASPSAPPGDLTCVTPTTDQRNPSSDTGDDSDHEFDFGYVDVDAGGVSTTMTCTASAGTVTVGGFSVTNDGVYYGPHMAFSFAGGSSAACPTSGTLVLATGESCTVTVTFDPEYATHDDAYTIRIDVPHDGANGPRDIVSFEGTGYHGID